MARIESFDQFSINEYYSSEKLYLKSAIVKRLQSAPGYIRSYIPKLPDIRCTDGNGNDQICTRIPEVLYQYLFGNF